MNYSTVIFDLFGTLVNDFTSVAGQTHDELAVILNVPYEPFMKQWREITARRTLGEFQTVEASIEHVCGALGVAVNAEQMAKAVEFRLEYTRRALTPKPDAVATLAQLKHTGFKVGLLSNCSIEIPILWPETEFADLIESPIFSSRERLKKPHPRIYQIACERLDVAPQDCLYIADGENHELKAAEAFGMNPVLIRPKSHEPRGDLRQEAREWQGPTISALAEVLGLIDKTNASGIPPHGVSCMTIRDATEADLPAIIAIYNATIAGRMATADTQPVSVESRRNWFRDHDPAKRPLWVAVDDDVIVGWLSFQSFYGRPAYHATAELSIYVAPDCQRKGIGHALLTQAIEHAPRLGLKTLLGFIFAHNDASLRLFEKLGFQRWGVLPRVAELDGVERDLIIVGRSVLT